MKVDIEKFGRIAVITIDRPPVNALSQALRKLIEVRLDEAAGDEAVKGVVLACAGRTFVAAAWMKSMPFSLAIFSSLVANSSWSSSTSEEPVSRPRALRNVKTMPPPMTMEPTPCTSQPRKATSTCCGS